jgi:uncharacterized DUF497 family protein
MYFGYMEITWNPTKATHNYQKHKVRFSDVEPALYDPMALTTEEQDIDGERRLVTLGADSIGRIVLVVYAYRPEGIRLISARKATASKRKYYEKRI